MNTTQYEDLLNSVVEIADKQKQKQFIIDLMNLAYTDGQIIGMKKATQDALNIISPDSKPKQSENNFLTK